MDRYPVHGLIVLAAAEGMLAASALALPEILIFCDCIRCVCAAVLNRRVGGRDYGGALLYAISALWQLVFIGTWRIPMMCTAVGEGLILVGLIFAVPSVRRVILPQTVVAAQAILTALFLVRGKGVVIHRAVRAAVHVTCAASVGLMLLEKEKTDLQK